MIALHLSFLDGVTCVWAERGAIEKKSRTTPLNPLAHPYDAGMKGLHDVLERLQPGIDVTARNTDLLHAWLPSTDAEPLASSPMLRDIPENAAATVRPWLVTVRRLEVLEALQLVTSLTDEALAGTGILPGDSLIWCHDAFLPVIRMIAQGSFLPGLRIGDEGAVAHWLPTPDDDTVHLTAQLARTMPAVCRCLGASSRTPPASPPERVLAAAIEAQLDTMMRLSDRTFPLPKKGRHGYASVHDAWLVALVSENPVVRWDDQQELAELAAQLEQWRRPADLTIASPFRLCFRLSEPDVCEDAAAVPEPATARERLAARRSSAAPTDRWPVDYFLQLKSDPSAMAPVAELWNPKSRVLREFDRRGNTLEFVLSALGQAASLDPAIARALKNKRPTGHALDTADAADFLRSRADLLRTAGFSVILPSWWLGKGTQNHLSLRLVTKPMGNANDGAFSLNSIVRFNIGVSLGGEMVSVDELRALAHMKVPLVRVRGQWMLIDRQQLDAALKGLDARGKRSAPARDIVRLALGADTRSLGIPIDGVEASGWLQGLLGVLRRESDPVALDIPARFTGTLRPYQARGYSWLGFMRQWGLGACLADDMGLGKTVQTLALILRERERGEKLPVLLICPMSVLNTWRKEAEKFAPGLAVHIHHGADRMQRVAFGRAAARSAIVVTSYGLLHRDVETLKAMRWAGVVLDEAQNIKNPDTKHARAARAIPAEYRLALTGTPVENHVGDLWSLMEFLNPGLLGNHAAFKRTFFVPIQIARDTQAAQRLKSITGPFILRREKRDKSVISDLPEKIEMKTYCTLTKEQATLYQAVLEDMQESVQSTDGIKRSGLVLALLTKLKQVCNHPAQFLRDGSALDGRSGKLARLKELLGELRPGGERALVFTQYAEMGELLQHYLQEQFREEALFLHGAVPKGRRDAMVERFQNDERGPRVFILSLKAGGTGLHLTRATHVIHYDRWWNPAVENQATDRAFRIGQKRNVEVHTFIVAGTLEERIDELIERKSGIAASIVGTGEQWLSKLSNEELRDMIRLSDDALEE